MPPDEFIFTSETLVMNKEQTIYVAVGGGNGGNWNGGGIGLNKGNNQVPPGGGATSIQKSLISDGQLYHYESVKNTEVLIVAGGGGGSEWFYSLTDQDTPIGGAGGGTVGGDGATGYITNQPSCPGAKGGTQDTGGNSTGLLNSQSIVDGIFGRGGYTIGGDGGGQGGGGWYGGGGGSGHIGTMCINGSMLSGVREGNGYCVITWQQLPQ